MSDKSDFYLKEKKLKNTPRHYRTLIDIKEVNDLGNRILIIGDDFKTYSYFKDNEDRERFKEEFEMFENKLKVGSQIAVYVTVREKDGKTYLNVSPDYILNN